MEKIGIVGGLAWLSTADYYSEICRRSERWHVANNLPGVPSTPEMIIESLDLNKAVSYFGIEGDELSWSRFDDYHRAALQRLEAGGAKVALIASNTPHHRFAAIVQGIKIPVISILDVVARKTSEMGAKQVLILGTALTMSSPKFREEFAKYGIEAAGPEDEGTRLRTVGLIADLQSGRSVGAAEQLGNIAHAAFAAQFGGKPTVCLACTELPLAFQAQKTTATFEYDGISYINTTTMHINAICDFALV